MSGIDVDSPLLARLPQRDKSVGKDVYDQRLLHKQSLKSDFSNIIWKQIDTVSNKPKNRKSLRTKRNKET